MLKVLIVEDEELIRRGIVLGTDWAALNCVVVAQASNGYEGLIAAEKYKPSLIITDLKMPKMGGLEMVEELRKAGNNAFVIILTAHDSFNYAQKALRLGAVDFLLKPYHDGELEKTINQLHKRLEEGQNTGDIIPVPQKEKGDKSKYLYQAMDYISENYGDFDISVGSIAQHTGISEGHLSHIFKKEAACTPLAYLSRYRIQKAMELLKDIHMKVYEVAELVGYKDVTYFSTKFKQIVGMSPSEYQDTCR